MYEMIYKWNINKNKNEMISKWYENEILMKYKWNINEI